MYHRREREPSKKWKHEALSILKDLMFTSFKTLTLCFYRYIFSDVRVLKDVNIKSLSIDNASCFHFLVGSRLLLPVFTGCQQVFVKTPHHRAGVGRQVGIVVGFVNFRASWSLFRS